MSLRVRRMTLGLATLTLLTSLFLVAQGFLNAPEALASCPEQTWCDPPIQVESQSCCCTPYPASRLYAIVWQFCYWQEWDCTINTYAYLLNAGCFGGFCWCPE